MWGLWLGADGFAVQVFFLSCVLVAGLYGAATASRKILFVQALPAALGLGLLWSGVSPDVGSAALEPTYVGMVQVAGCVES